MAAAGKTSSTALAALALTVSLFLLSFAAPSEAAACGKSSPATVPAAVPSGGRGGKCPVNALKLGVCADVLGGLASLLVGDSPAAAASSGSGKKKPCCELVAGLADVDAAVCLCTAVKARVLGVVELYLPVQLRLVNQCGKKIPDGFRCSSYIIDRVRP
ncbi:putative lipid-binding protein AIR1 [Brachypodium distachyon]|uniref:Bifunctional inhibitor/plant lipid transfer protein/seed storage helical domain-containing protein n=1 Tax=Brachypodium distachyon TaxID=15368 RepID=I1I603_BRADI|nr:putative lipid-binding protein AIR1 [Brachypodium distachyon]KQJ97735.1 hypothetical protein BRADI_3g32910v3 [Brachypodium distachyon]|eukprot:XP_003572054.1 putative lipid-binding protein AIR1 [Brachypodium distachyon]